MISLQWPRKGCSLIANKTTTDAIKEKNKTNNNNDVIESRLSVKYKTNNNDDIIESRLSVLLVDEDEAENSSNSAMSKEKTNKAQVLMIQLPSSRVDDTATPNQLVHQTKTLHLPAMQSGQEGAATVVMKHGHSMFLNCVPLTREQLGHDVLAKIRSSIRNTIFRSAKSYPKPSHADLVVGICLYDCDVCIPGVKGNFVQTK